MHRLKHGGKDLLRVHVGRGRDPDAAGAGGPQVGKNVAEEVAAHHHVEPVRVLDEVRREDVDVVLVSRNVRIVGGHGAEAFVPEGHGVDDAVRLGRRGEVLLRPSAGEVERVAHDAVHPVAGEDGLLDRDLPLRALEEPAADLRVLTLGVLPHDHEVDVLRRAAGQRRSNARQQAHRPQIHVLVEASADGYQQAPERHVVRHLGVAHGAEKDGVEGPELLQAVLGHHRTGLKITFAGVGKLGELHGKLEAVGKRLQGPHPFGHDLAADAVAGDQRDTIGHASS